MSYNPFVNDKSHKMINLEALDPAAKELTVLIRRFDEGHYQKWQNAISAIPDEDKKDAEKRKASTRDALLEIGAMEWNFKDEKGKAVPLDKKAIQGLDAAVSGYIRDEIYKYNPCFWTFMNDREAKRLGLEGKVKNA